MEQHLGRAEQGLGIDRGRHDETFYRARASYRGVMACLARVASATAAETYYSVLCGKGQADDRVGTSTSCRSRSTRSGRTSPAPRRPTRRSTATSSTRRSPRWCRPTRPGGPDAVVRRSSSPATRRRSSPPGGPTSGWRRASAGCGPPGRRRDARAGAGDDRGRGGRRRRGGLGRGRPDQVLAAGKLVAPSAPAARVRPRWCSRSPPSPPGGRLWTVRGRRRDHRADRRRADFGALGRWTGGRSTRWSARSA